MKTFRRYSETISNADEHLLDETIELDEGILQSLSKVAILGKLRSLAKKIEGISASKSDADEKVREKLILQNQMLGKGLFWVGALIVAGLIGKR